MQVFEPGLKVLVPVINNTTGVRIHRAVKKLALKAIE
jgi:hypothetical protein